MLPAITSRCQRIRLSLDRKDGWKRSDGWRSRSCNLQTVLSKCISRICKSIFSALCNCAYFKNQDEDGVPCLSRSRWLHGELESEEPNDRLTCVRKDVRPLFTVSVNTCSGYLIGRIQDTRHNGSCMLLPDKQPHSHMPMEP